MLRPHPLLLSVVAGLLLPVAAAAQEDTRAACGAPEWSGAPVLGGAAHRQASAVSPGGDRPRRHAGILRARDLTESACPRSDGIVQIPSTIRLVGNSAYPSDQYEGALWAGRGVSTLLSSGAGVHMGILELVVAPELTYQQNRGFRIVPQTDRTFSEFVYP